MSPLATLRALRHGPLRRLGPLWVAAGDVARFFLLRFGRSLGVSHHIGPYGPFKLSAYFAFSNFKAWGDRHNNGFQVLIETCRDAGCVFDVGGHVGLVTLPISQALRPGGQVVTFEPSTANLWFLRRHLELNAVDNVTVVDALVGDRPGEVTFHESDRPSAMNNQIAYRGAGREEPARRRQITLDAYCAETGWRPEIVKIDVEGAEVNVLAGARALLTRHRPLVFLSVHPTHLRAMGSSAEALAALIDDLGYTVEEIGGGPVTEFQLSEYVLRPRP